MTARSHTSILVVDDTVENLQLLSSMLEAHGYEIRPVISGRQALLAAKSYAPELVLLDVGMPEMDGYEVCQRFKADPELRDIPIIFLTALSNAQDKLKAFEAGGADYISKPFQLDEVLARVRVHVGLRHSQSELQQSYLRLQALERLRDDLVHMVVHDMRSPLMALMLLLENVREALPAAKAGHLTQDLMDAVQAAASVNRMANDLLDVSRLEEGKLTLDRQPHDLVQVCREAATRSAALDRTLAIEVAGEGELEVRCDRNLVDRVVDNLLSNAIKHTPTGGRIRLSALSLATTVGRRARVAVQDQGAGVPAEARSKIFEKFGAMQARKQSSFHSAGLGLAFCKLAVEAHGGTIGVDRAEPYGSVFWFVLPV